MSSSERPETRDREHYMVERCPLDGSPPALSTQIGLPSTRGVNFQGPGTAARGQRTRFLWPTKEETGRRKHDPHASWHDPCFLRTVLIGRRPPPGPTPRPPPARPARPPPRQPGTRPRAARPPPAPPARDPARPTPVVTQPCFTGVPRYLPCTRPMAGRQIYRDRCSTGRNDIRIGRLHDDSSMNAPRTGALGHRTGSGSRGRRAGCARFDVSRQQGDERA